MLKGLALTPPIVGRISIGKVVERGGKRLPEKDDEFTLTSQVQSHGTWVPHPLNETLRQARRRAQAKDRKEDPSGNDRSVKLRSIPVRLLFDDPDLSLRSAYTLFDRSTGRPLCVGNGDTCKRVAAEGIQSQPCPSPKSCGWSEGRCKPFGRLNVRVGDDDDLGSFVLRTTGFNTIRTLATRLRYFHAASGGKLSTLPLELRLRGKSTQQSFGTPIYYVDLTVRHGMGLTEAVALARTEWEARRAAGLDQAALDAQARHGLSLGAFEESAEEAGTIVEEFFPPMEGDVVGSRPVPQAPLPPRTRTRTKSGQPPAPAPLGERLARKAEDAGIRLEDAP